MLFTQFLIRIPWRPEDRMRHSRTGTGIGGNL